MNDKPAPRHVTRFVEELVECGVQLARMLDHMYLHETDDPEIPPPPEVLRDLVAKTLEPSLKRRKRDIYTATALLLETGRTIEREIFLRRAGRDSTTSSSHGAIRRPRAKRLRGFPIALPA